MTCLIVYPRLDVLAAREVVLRCLRLGRESWDAWVRMQDADVRARLERREEDTLTNLLLFGATFTSEYRIDDEYHFHYGQSNLVNSVEALRRLLV